MNLPLFKRWSRARDADLTSPHLRVGLWGERVAETGLNAKGYRTLGRRVRIGRHDEIDLVMQCGDVLVFVEVKTPSNEDFGRPAQAIKQRKRIALSRAARHYLRRLKYRPRYYRFDVVEVIGSPDHRDAPVVRHIEAALQVSNAPFPLVVTPY